MASNSERIAKDINKDSKAPGTPDLFQVLDHLQESTSGVLPFNETPSGKWLIQSKSQYNYILAKYVNIDLF